MCSFSSCQMRFEFLSQSRKVRNAFECFVTQVQTRLAYEDKRDLYCINCEIKTPYAGDSGILLLKHGQLTISKSKSSHFSYESCEKFTIFIKLQMVKIISCILEL